MSMYNMLFGKNPASDLLLAMLGLTQGDMGRFRDCFPADDGKEIHVYTRNGGGNRETYMPDFSAHPEYLGDQDDDYDCTYATIRFRTPERFVEAVKVIADRTDTTPPMEKFKRLISDMQADKDNAVVSRALEVGKRLFGAIQAGESQTISTPDGSVVLESHPPAQKEKGI